MGMLNGSLNDLIRDLPLHIFIDGETGRDELLRKVEQTRFGQQMNEAFLARQQPRTFAEPATFPDRVRAECKALADMLIAKNQAYGNSALDPVRVFSKASPVEQLLVRIDDKLSRLARASNGTDTEDVILDLLGYLILLRLARAEGK